MELNEAFAAQVIPIMAECDIPETMCVAGGQGEAMLVERLN